MRQAIKNKGAVMAAYELGAGSPMERELAAEGKIRMLPDGTYELFSLEAVNGSGERARAGDFFKTDGRYPYPISRDYFLANHTHLEGDLYRQTAKPLWAWTAEDALCPEIEYLLRRKGLTLCPERPEAYFTAPLWGTVESAARDAVLVFYEIRRNGDGEILDVNFNFVERSVFDATYSWVE